MMCCSSCLFNSRSLFSDYVLCARVPSRNLFCSCMMYSVNNSPIAPLFLYFSNWITLSLSLMELMSYFSYCSILNMSYFNLSIYSALFRDMMLFLKLDTDFSSSPISSIFSSSTMGPLFIGWKYFNKDPFFISTSGTFERLDSRCD